jgi:hypothetical protein
VADDQKKKKEAAETSKHAADQRYKDTYRRTGNHRAAVRDYCGNNKWAQENAKNTGNW